MQKTADKQYTWHATRPTIAKLVQSAGSQFFALTSQSGEKMTCRVPKDGAINSNEITVHVMGRSVETIGMDNIHSVKVKGRLYKVLN